MGRGALWAANDRVIRRRLREVDARLVGSHFTRRGDGLLPVGGKAIRGDGVTVGRHNTETVGVNGVPVDPGLLFLRKASKVEFTHRDDGVTALTIDGVAVDEEARIKGVVGTGLLKLLNSLADHLRVEQSNLRGRFRVFTQLTGLSTGRCVIGRVVQIIQTIGTQGRINIVLNVGSV